MGAYDPFLTSYRHDYNKKDLEHEIVEYRSNSIQQFKDPIIEPFKEFLSINELPENDKEHVKSFLEKFKESKPHLFKKYCKDGLNLEILNRYLYPDGSFRTTYQEQFGNIEKELQYAERVGQIKLAAKPEKGDTATEPTTHRVYYRNPLKINKRALRVVKPIKPSHQLGTEERFLKLMKYKTGKSEYQGSIGKLGDIIINDDLHGKVTYKPCRYS